MPVRRGGKWNDCFKPVDSGIRLPKIIQIWERLTKLWLMIYWHAFYDSRCSSIIICQGCFLVHTRSPTQLGMDDFIPALFDPLKVIGDGANRLLLYDFLYAFCCKFVSISHHFRDIGDWLYVVKCTFSTPTPLVEMENGHVGGSRQNLVSIN